MDTSAEFTQGFRNLWDHWSGLINGYTGGESIYVWGVLIILAFLLYRWPKKAFLISISTFFIWSVTVCISDESGIMTGPTPIALAMYTVLMLILIGLGFYLVFASGD
jgi:hypothetical protein